MKSKGIKLVCVGKIKFSYWKEAAAHYLKLLERWRPVQCHEVKDGDSCLPASERLAREKDAILNILSGKDLLIPMHETGKNYTSREFALFLRRLDEREARCPAFIIGGPYGLDKSLMAMGTPISLSALTWPHELARVLLLEQLFRAESIIRNFPYHN